jgi:hypothetical protein
VLRREAAVGLVDEGGGLQGVAAALAAKIGGGAAAQLVVDQRDELVARGEIALAPRLQEARDRLGRGGFRSGDGGVRL